MRTAWFNLANDFGKAYLTKHWHDAVIGRTFSDYKKLYFLKKS
jgi:hypothetical protein